MRASVCESESVCVRARERECVCVPYMVVRGAEQAATQVGVPGEAVPLLLMTPQTQVRTALSRGV